MTENAWPVTIMPIITPIVDKTTAESVSTE